MTNEIQLVDNLEHLTDIQIQHPWDRMPGESSAAYQKFVIFKSLIGTERNIRRSYIEYLKLKGKPNSEASPPKDFYIMSKTYKWAERAGAHDEYQARQFEEKVAVRREQEFEARMKVNDAARMVALDFLAAADPNRDRIDVAALVNSLASLGRESRMEFVEQKKIEATQNNTFNFATLLNGAMDAHTQTTPQIIPGLPIEAMAEIAAINEDEEEYIVEGNFEEINSESNLKKSEKSKSRINPGKLERMKNRKARVPVKNQ